jgi:hypothetical protein
MRMMLLLLALGMSVPFAAAADTAPSAGQRIRLRTDVPPWIENKTSREVAGEVLREDEDSLTFQPREGGEPLTGTKRGQWLIAEFVTSDDSYVTVRLPKSGDLLRVPTRLVSRIEISKGGSRGRSAAIYALIAGTAFGVAAYATYEPAIGLPDRTGTTILAAGGWGFLGALAGASTGGEGWRPIEKMHLRVGVGRTRGGARAQVAFSF